jgi:hypothetical protein
MKHWTLVAALCLLAAVPTLAGANVRMEAKVYYSSSDELTNKLGSLLGELDVCTHGVTADGRAYLVIDTDQDQLRAIESRGLRIEITYQDIRDKFREMTGRNPDDGSFRDFGYYFTYWEMRDTIYKLAQNYPQLVTIDSSMRSFQHRYLYCLRISSGPSVKSQVFINGATHAREPMGTSTCIVFASLLCTRYGADSMTTWLVNNREVYVVPVMNPDGYIYNSDSGGSSSNWRKNRNNTSPRTGPGVDLNRNYGYKWGYDNNGSSPTPSSETYRGPSRFSEPETQVVRDFEAAHKFRTELDFHTYGQYNLYPYGYANILPHDSLLYFEIADSFEANNGYTTGSVYRVLYTTNGTSIEWEGADTLAGTKFYTYALTTELGTTDFWYGWNNPSYVDAEVALNTPNCYYLTRMAGVYLDTVRGGLVINDTASGNGNGQLDPGENTNFWFKIRNRCIHRLDTAKTVTAVLRTSDTMVQVITPSVNFPAVPRATQADNHASQIQVRCSPNATPGSHVNLRLELTYSDDGTSIMQPLNYRITIGNHPTALYDRKPDYSHATLSLSVASNPAHLPTVFNTVVSSSSAPGTLTIYAQDGQLIRSLNNIASGASRVFWDGRNRQGKLVPAGIYFAKLQTRDCAAFTKMILAD